MKYFTFGVRLRLARTVFRVLETAMNKGGFYHLTRKVRTLVLGAALVLATFSLPQKAHAFLPPCIALAPNWDVCLAQQIIEQEHDIFEDQLMQVISDEMRDYRAWLMSTFFRDNVLPALMLFTQQMSAVAMHQVMIIGTFLDAKHQLETQRLFQELQVQAHKDYHPSEDFCWFGTNVRSMAASEQRARFNSVAFSQVELDRHLGKANAAAAESRDQDKAYRWAKFVAVFCDPKDNNWRGAGGPPGTGLTLACGGVNPPNRARVNIDIDYTRAIDEPRTLDVDFTNGGAVSNGEEDVIALGNNLYGHDVLTRNAFGDLLKDKEYQHLYMALRSVAAKRSVAENSYNAIVGLKSAGTPGMSGAAGTPTTSQFLGAVLTELGVPPADVYTIIGNNPSYYAQLEILAKKIYQNPDFYSNLYDKPANIARKGVALKAIELMLDRAIYESQLRQEMATSVLLSSKLHKPLREINKGLATAGSN